MATWEIFKIWALSLILIFNITYGILDWDEFFSLFFSMCLGLGAMGQKWHNFAIKNLDFCSCSDFQLFLHNQG